MRKLCKKCNTIKDFSDFSKDKCKRDKLRSICKKCDLIRKKNRKYNINKKRINEYNKKYYIKNKNEIRRKKYIYDQKYYQINKKTIKNKKVDYYNKNSNKIKKLQKLKYNKEYYTNYRQKNKTRLNQKRGVYLKNRRESDIYYKLEINRRRGLNRFLKSDKKLHTHEYFCCTTQELWNHLEKQFRDGMTRENYGKVWHVDHIIPLQFFRDNDLMDETNIKIAWHFGNLQPLLAKENYIKNNNLYQTNFKY